MLTTVVLCRDPTCKGHELKDSFTKIRTIPYSIRYKSFSGCNRNNSYVVLGYIEGLGVIQVTRHTFLNKLRERVEVI